MYIVHSTSNVALYYNLMQYIVMQYSVPNIYFVFNIFCKFKSDVCDCWSLLQMVNICYHMIRMIMIYWFCPKEKEEKKKKSIRSFIITTTERPIAPLISLRFCFYDTSAF